MIHPKSLFFSERASALTSARYAAFLTGGTRVATWSFKECFTKAAAWKGVYPVPMHAVGVSSRI